jgi:predicted RNA-binding Zn-ribbon protein involved in translation (DUF1610 family)
MYKGNVVSSSASAETCPNCGEKAIVRSRPWYGLVLGPVLMVIGFLLGIATLGISFILTLFGIFLWMPSRRCESCGWSQRSDSRG